MKIEYTPKRKKGEQCKDCKHFKPKEKTKGKCFGHEVSAQGNCNFFKKK